MAANGSMDQAKLEGTQYVANVQAPGAPGQITYYPSKPTPEFKKKLRTDKAVGLTVVILGFAFVIAGFVMSFGIATLISAFILVIIIVAVISLILAIMFVMNDNVALAKGARAVPMVGYVILAITTILVILLLIAAIMVTMGSISDGSGGGTPPDVDSILSDVNDAMVGAVTILASTFVLWIGLLLMRAGATVLWDT